MPSHPVQTGLDVLRRDGFSALRDRRLGLLVHPASVAHDLTHLIDLSAGAGLDVRVLFEPEHGIFGTAQDMQAVPHGSFGRIHRVSLYGAGPDSLRPSADALAEIDLLLVDLQDVGSRYYTYAVTMRYCLEACAAAGVKVLIADRPNPINGVTVEGPLLQDDYGSFVGGYPVPVRHGLTIGELARLASAGCQDAELEVVPMQGWKRSMWFDDTGLPWVMPSPNMPTLDSATVYPGGCLVEASNLSEGRGTTRPFELIGAPWLDATELAGRLGDSRLPGVAFRPVGFTPTFQKHKGQFCQGVQLHVSDRDSFRPFLSGLKLLETARRLSGAEFQWRSEPYEFVSDRPAIDLLTGSSAVRQALDNGASLDDLDRSWQDEIGEFWESRRSVLLYGHREGP